MGDEPTYQPPDELVALIGELVKESPTMATLHEEHLEDNDELLPYLLLAEIARWYVERVERRSVDSSGYAEGRAVTELLDREFAEADPNGPVVNGISLGFLEGILPFGESEYPEYITVLPQHLLDEVRRMLGSATNTA